MAEAFKLLIHPGLVAGMGAHLRRAWRRFDEAGFVHDATQGLDDLAFKARAAHVADALQRHLPPDFDRAAGLVEQALAPPWPDDRLGSEHPGRDGLEGWALWPVGIWVARQGRGDPARALACLHAVTQRFTAEWAVRPFIADHPALAFDTLQRWTADPSAHVRRLASEGSRPRLPWGEQLRALVADPSPTAPLLQALQDDPSDYVRRSVANHLNDIAKDHPERVVDWVRQHLPGAPPERRALLRHASRSLVKASHPGMLQAWGLGGALRGDASLALTPARLVLGQSLQLRVTLRSSARRAQVLEVDYAVHHVKADGSLRPKVFKGWRLTLAAGETRVLLKQHAVRPITTRRYHPGAHRVDLRVNGRVLAEAGFELRLG